MAAPKITSLPLQRVAYATNETAILQNAALFLAASADNTARLPAAAASTLPFLGFAEFAQVSGEVSTQLITEGVAIGIAEAAIASGARVEAGSATGTVQTATTGTVIGIAQTAADNAGDLVSIRIIRP